MPSWWTRWNALLLLGFCTGVHAISVVDDSGHTVTLARPAQRIISLAPHATELLFAAGAGAAVIGVSQYSDYPVAARHIASIGGAAAFDLERIVSLKPDLIIVWSSGNSAAQVARLRELRIPIFDSDPRDYATVASSLERLAAVAGTTSVGLSAASAFRTRLASLTATYRQRPVVSVFYQIWQAPLMTLNGSHIASQAITLCGGKNIFAQLPQIAPVVGTEAVLQANPEVILTGSSDTSAALSGWRRFPALHAVRAHNLLTIDADLLSRAGPRVLDGTEQVCRALDGARARRAEPVHESAH
jgi:iron complex transport system substrate-binding protein